MTSTEATAAGSSSPGIWNLPNILTMLRIALVPFFVWFLLADAPGLRSESGLWRWAAVAAFAVAIYTDKLDGDIARSRGLITNFGKIADPIADKLLIGSALVMLSVLGELPWWVTIVILVREWGITALRFCCHPLRCHPGLARRQTQDCRADGRDLPLSAAPGRAGAVAGLGGIRRHDGGCAHYRMDRRRIRG